MKLFDAKFVFFVVLILVVGLGSAHWYGSDLEASHPNGMWIYTPPANHVGPTPPAYPIGFDLAIFAVGVLSLVPSFVFWVITRFWFEPKRRLARQMVLASVVACALFLVASGLVAEAYAH